MTTQEGVIRSWGCKLFGPACTPGACAAYYPEYSNPGRFAREREVV